MKVAIYANISGYSSGAGGVQTYLAALIKALGALNDGPEQYILLGPAKDAEWLDAVRGPNQSLMKLAEFGRDWGRQPAHRIGRVITYITNRFHSVQDGQIHTKWSAQTGIGNLVPISNGFMESLGVSVVHFPYQSFILTSIPSIYVPHDLQHLHLPQNFTPDQLMGRELTYPFACRMASRVVATSNWVAEDLRNQYGIPASKITVIRWGGPSFHFPEPSASDVRETRAKYKLEQDYIFYPAIPWLHKNHRGLFQAMNILRSRGQAITLALCGAGTNRSDFLLNLGRQTGVSNAVRLLGYVSGAELRALYRGAVALVVPSFFEAANGLIAEAWLDGTPAACSDIPGHKEGAEGAATFFDPHVPESIANAIEKVMCDFALREQLVAAGRAKLVDLSWRETAEQYRTLYREVAKQGGTLHD